MQAARENEEKKKIHHCNVVQTDDVGVCGAGVDAGVGAGVDAVVDAGVLVGVAANLCGWQPSWSELVLQATENSPTAAPAPLEARKITPSLEICNGHISWINVTLRNLTIFSLTFSSLSSFLSFKLKRRPKKFRPKSVNFLLCHIHHRPQNPSK